MSDDQIEAMILDLVETNLSEDACTAATEWLERHSSHYKAMIELGLVDQPERAVG